MFENEQLLLTKLFFNYFWSQCSGQNQLQLHAAFETMSNPCAGFGYERFNQAEETNLRVMENGSEQITFERHVKHSKDILAICSLTRSVSRKWQQMQAGQRKGLVRVSESYRNAQRKIQGKGAANLNYSRLFDTLGSSQKILAQVRHQSFSSLDLCGSMGAFDEDRPYKKGRHFLPEIGPLRHCNFKLDGLLFMRRRKKETQSKS